MELEDIKLFLRVDTNEDDTLIEGLQLAGEEYLTNAGIIKDYTKELYKLAVRLLIGHWYDNRIAVNIGSISKNLEYSLSSIILQLKYTQVEVV